MINDFLEDSGNFGSALDKALIAVKTHYSKNANVACKITGTNSNYCSDSELGY